MVTTRSNASVDSVNPAPASSAEGHKFLIGTAISGEGELATPQYALSHTTYLKTLGDAVYQNSGDVNSNWDHFVGRRAFYGMLPTIQNGDSIGPSCDFWNRY